jgi:hypothetical protein
LQFAKDIIVMALWYIKLISLCRSWGSVFFVAATAAAAACCGNGYGHKPVEHSGCWRAAFRALAGGSCLFGLA